MDNISIHFEQGTYKKYHICRGYKHYDKLYIHKTNLHTYIVCTTQKQSLDTMIKIRGGYHFDTLKALKKALKFSNT